MQRNNLINDIDYGLIKYFMLHYLLNKRTISFANKYQQDHRWSAKEKSRLTNNYFTITA